MAENFNGLRIELRPHIGKMMTLLGMVSIEHDQWIVVAHTDNAKPVHLGYYPKRDGARVLYLTDIKEELPPVFLAEIERQAAQMLERASKGKLSPDESLSQLGQIIRLANHGLRLLEEQGAQTKPFLRLDWSK